MAWRSVGWGRAGECVLHCIRPCTTFRATSESSQPHLTSSAGLHQPPPTSCPNPIPHPPPNPILQLHVCGAGGCGDGVPAVRRGGGRAGRCATAGRHVPGAGGETWGGGEEGEGGVGEVGRWEGGVLRSRVGALWHPDCHFFEACSFWYATSPPVRKHLHKTAP